MYRSMVQKKKYESGKPPTSVLLKHSSLPYRQTVFVVYLLEVLYLNLHLQIYIFFQPFFLSKYSMIDVLFLVFLCSENTHCMISVL